MSERRSSLEQRPGESDAEYGARLMSIAAGNTPPPARMIEPRPVPPPWGRAAPARTPADHEAECRIPDDVAQRALSRTLEPTPIMQCFPQGLVGEIAQWIVGTARRPMREGALAVALAVVGTAMGRHVAGPTENGTHLYNVVLAPTAAGKEHLIACTGDLLDAGGMASHLGAGVYQSGPALFEEVAEKALLLSAMDEYGSILARINHPKASGWDRQLSEWLRSLWGKSFGKTGEVRWANRDKKKPPIPPVTHPAFSLLGVSTVEDFRDGLGEGDVKNGLLNRHLIFETPEKASDRDPEFRRTDGVPGGLAIKLSSIYRHGFEETRLMPNPVHAGNHAYVGGVFRMGWEREGKAGYDTLQGILDQYGEAAPEEAAFYGRSAEMAVRIATIIAFGDSRETVNDQDFGYGSAVSLESARTMLRLWRARGASNFYSEQGERVAAFVKQRGTLRRGDLSRKFRSVDVPTMNKIVHHLADAGVIQVTRAHGEGRHPQIITWIG